MLLKEICDSSPQVNGFYTLLSEEIGKVEAFLKYEYAEHLEPESACSTHCIRNSLASDAMEGNKRKHPCAITACEHEHDEFCKDCDKMLTLQKNTEKIISKAENDSTVPAEKINLFRKRLDRHQINLLRYRSRDKCEREPHW